MKSICILLLCSLVFTQLSQAQEKDTTRIEHLRGSVFSHNGMQLTNPQLSGILRSNNQAFEYMEKANANLPGMYILSYAGGFMVGWPIGTAAAGGDPEWGLAAAGIGCILLAIPLANGYKKNALKAVEIYNNDLGTPTAFYRKKKFFQIGQTNNGIGLKINLN